MNVNIENFVFRTDSDEYRIVNDVLWIISIKKKDIDSMTIGEKTITLITKLDGEVGNGGFVQYFLNTNGAFIADTIMSFKRINDYDFYLIFKQAITIFNSKLSKEVKEREWQELDNQYYILNNSRLYRLLVSYIKENLHEFK
ncbi:DMP19 family protein [Neobacillus sp. SAB-20_R2A]|uniref:DMP19 family protein n=1 Tax=Neobacillus sp. SAB-20_R2A TaxID=3120519 RepID=UPI003C6E8C04